MGKLSSFFSKIPFLSGLGGKKKSAKSNVELQYDKAINLMENGNAEDAVEIFEKIVDIAIMDPNYKNFGTDALKILGELYETGKYSNCIVDVDLNKATQYYEKYTNLSKDGEMIYKLAQMLLDIQNFSKAITFFEKATECGIKAASWNHGLWKKRRSRRNSADYNGNTVSGTRCLCEGRTGRGGKKTDCRLGEKRGIS
jgi:tetratricopeptide (TPR) repeat protein